MYCKEVKLLIQYDHLFKSYKKIKQYLINCTTNLQFACLSYTIAICNALKETDQQYLFKHPFPLLQNPLGTLGCSPKQAMTPIIRVIRGEFSFCICR